MTAEHKTCYRCERPIRDLVDPARPLARDHGICDDCRLRVEAEGAAGAWRRDQDIPREISNPFPADVPPGLTQP